MVDLNQFFENLQNMPTTTAQQDNDQDLMHKNLDAMSDEEKDTFYKSNDFQQYSVKNTENFVSNTLNREGKNVQEIFGLSGKTCRYSFNCFHFLETDHEDYLDIVDASSILQNTLAEGEALLPTFKYLLEDIFMSLYQYDAEVLPAEEMHVESYMNRNILSKLVNTPVYIALRKACRCDMFNAGIGTEIIGQKAIEILKEELKKIKDFEQKREAFDKLIQHEEEMDYLSDQIDDLQDQLDELMAQGGDQDEIDDLMNQMNADQMSLDQARQMANQMAQACDELVEDSLTDDIADEIAGNAEMQQTIDNATSEVHQLSQYVQAWGMGEGGNTKVPYGVKKSVLETIRNSDQLKKFTDMIGKYKECALDIQQKKAKTGAVEIKSVTTGDKIQNVLPSDKMNLCNDITKKDFYRRMTQNQLLTYDKESNKDKNKGPIIICIDRSGSMIGDSIEWAKALAVGILEIAQLQKREFACIPYDSYVLPTIEIAKDEISPDKILKIAQIEASGGTNFEAPLEVASKLIDDSKYKNADIVFITDGDCMIPDAFKRKFKQLKEDKDFRTLGVVIDYNGYATDTTLKEFCDSVTNISSIAEAKNAQSQVNQAIFGAL